MRISDWSSDVCSSDLPPASRPAVAASSSGAAPVRAFSIEKENRKRLTFSRKKQRGAAWTRRPGDAAASGRSSPSAAMPRSTNWCRDRKSVVEGQSVSGRVALGGRQILKKKKKQTKNKY